ncbi:MAG: GNAT family N-acetyltransferase [Saprospiraceae bacterium]|nr:GNAT family N-acetyltransferase [Saprospiraceae bacterium]
MKSGSMHTSRLTFRPLLKSDAANLFMMDADPLVMRYLGNNPINNIEEVYHYLENIKQQYRNNGIGRWAVIENETNAFVGWAGIKFLDVLTNGHINFYDIGYRFLPEFWGKGYATECTKAWIDYAKLNMNIHELFAITHIDNLASQKVLKKCGFVQKNTFPDSTHGEEIDCIWFELKW